MKLTWTEISRMLPSSSLELMHGLLLCHFPCTIIAALTSSRIITKGGWVSCRFYTHLNKNYFLIHMWQTGVSFSDQTASKARGKRPHFRFLLFSFESLFCNLHLMHMQLVMSANKRVASDPVPSHLAWEELFAGSSVWMVEIFSPIISSELWPCEELAGPFSAECCFELLPSSDSMKASLLWGLMNCTLSLGATTAAPCWLGFRMQWERVETQVFLKFSFMKAYTMGLLKLLKNPMALTMAVIMLSVTPSYFFSRSSGKRDRGK